MDDPAATDADRRLIRRTYEIARDAAARGNHPFGALLALRGEILGEFENAVVTRDDLTLHAETGLARKAARRFDRETLAAATLYTSTEPCLMCAGAIRWAGIGRVAYGASGPRTCEVLGETWHGIPAKETFERNAPHVEVVGPVEEEEGLRVHRECW